ncbi:MAG TPA: hypothetical protein VGJ45_08355, partial [Pseudonocardiaceae bacterium]
HAVRADAVPRGNRGKGLTGQVEFGRFLGLALAECGWLRFDATSAELVTYRISVNVELGGKVVDGGARSVVGDQSVDFVAVKLTGRTWWNARRLGRVRCA